LFVVEDAFEITGRGLILAPDLVPQGKERFRIGDFVLLKSPDGSTFKTDIGGIGFLNPSPTNHGMPLLFNNLKKKDIPIGTEVWSIDEA
jgi:hypothetical protein